MRRLAFFVFIAVIVVLSISYTGLCASEYPDWTGYPPMNAIRDVVEFQGKVYCATPGGLFRYDPDTQEYTLYYKNHGLVSNDVTCLGATSKELFIGFREEGLWRMDPSNGSVEQILFPEYHIRTTANPTGITLYDIYAKNDSVLYIGHENGVDLINIVTEELKTYSQLGSEISENKPVEKVTIIDGKLWASTSMGVAVADESDPNLEFPEKWKDYTYTVQNKQYGITGVVYVGGDFDEYYFGTTTNGVLVLDKTSDTLIPTSSDKLAVSDIIPSNGEYFAATSTGLYSKKARLWWRVSEKYTDLTALAEGQDGKLWVGTEYNGLQCYTSGGYVPVPQPSGLVSTAIYQLALGSDGVVWATTAYRDESLNSSFQRLGDGVWSSYGNDIWKLTGRVVSAVVDQKGQVWTALWGSGVSAVFVIQDDGTPDVENDLILPVDDTREIYLPTMYTWYTVCSDIDVDHQGNIWVANFQSDPPDHKIETVPTSGMVVVDGYPVTKYQRYSPAEDNLPTSVILNFTTDKDGWIWCGTYNKGVEGIYVGNDPFDKSDTVIKQLTMNDKILSMRINAIACDNDGFVWVGSQAGLNRIEKTSVVGLTVEVMNDLLGADFRDIRAIEVDRNNNKWIGSNGGLVKLGADNTTVTEYTIKNSGLFSNSILSLKYDNANDVLWIGTDFGLNRFDVMGGEIANGTPDVRVYPNPFEIWGYDSRATFPNLGTKSSLKIYTFNGELVNELPAQPLNGGASAVWDGRNFDGGYVGSGVYFFSGVDEKGRTFRDKMAVIRR